MVEVMNIMATSFKSSHAHSAILSAPNPAAGHHWPTTEPLPETPGHSRASLGKSLVGSLLVSSGSWCTHFCLCLPTVCFPKSCVGSGGSMVALMATSPMRVYSTPRSVALAGSPLLTRTSMGDTQTQFCLSLGGVFGSWCTQGLFEPSECLWWVWGLILNMISPLLPSCFSFALGASWKWKNRVKKLP